MLEEAAEPATRAASLKEFRDDWMTTLDRENTMPWNPAGSPTWRMRRTTGQSSRSLLSSRRRGPVSLMRQRRTRAAEMYWEMMVARATPSTSIPKPMTKHRFRMTFTMPAAVRKYRGRWVSPWARRMAAPKL